MCTRAAILGSQPDYAAARAHIVAFVLAQNQHCGTSGRARSRALDRKVLFGSREFLTRAKRGAAESAFPARARSIYQNKQVNKCSIPFFFLDPRAREEIRAFIRAIIHRCFCLVIKSQQRKVNIRDNECALLSVAGTSRDFRELAVSKSHTSNLFSLYGKQGES